MSDVLTLLLWLLPVALLLMMFFCTPRRCTREGDRLVFHYLLGRRLYVPLADIEEYGAAPPGISTSVGGRGGAHVRFFPGMLSIRIRGRKRPLSIRTDRVDESAMHTVEHQVRSVPYETMFATPRGWRQLALYLLVIAWAIGIGYLMER